MRERKDMRLDLTDKPFGKLIAIKDVGSNKFKQRMWLCECSCGRVTEVASTYLVSGKVKSCGKCRNRSEERKQTHCDKGHLMTERLNGRSACNVCHSERQKQYDREQVEKDPEYFVKLCLKRSYKLSLEQYNEIFKSQNSVCAICKQPPKDGERLNVDHDHACCPGEKTCGKCIRGLLCRNCNHGIGNFKDNSSVIRESANYVDFWADRKENQIA